MKISIKAEGSPEWEDLDFLTESQEIEFIRVNDFLISPKAVKVLNQGLNTAHSEPVDLLEPTPPQTVIYGIVDLVKQRILNLHGPVQEIQRHHLSSTLLPPPPHRSTFLVFDFLVWTGGKETEMLEGETSERLSRLQ